MVQEIVPLDCLSSEIDALFDKSSHSNFSQYHDGCLRPLSPPPSSPRSTSAMTVLSSTDFVFNIGISESNSNTTSKKKVLSRKTPNSLEKSNPVKNADYPLMAHTNRSKTVRRAKVNNGHSAKKKKSVTFWKLSTMSSPDFDPRRLTERQQMSLIKKKSEMVTASEEESVLSFSPFVLDKIDPLLESLEKRVKKRKIDGRERISSLSQNSLQDVKCESQNQNQPLECSWEAEETVNSSVAESIEIEAVESNISSSNHLEDDRLCHLAMASCFVEPFTDSSYTVEAQSDIKPCFSPSSQVDVLKKRHQLEWMRWSTMLYSHLSLSSSCRAINDNNTNVNRPCSLGNHPCLRCESLENVRSDLLMRQNFELENLLINIS